MPSVALPYLPGNARYVLFLAAPAAVLLAFALAADRRGRRLVLAVLMAPARSAPWPSSPGTVRADARWRAFVADLEASAVRFCYTDFYLATKINFLSSERVVCTAKLGPTTTEYFFEYRDRVEAAPAAAFVAVNSTAARRLEDRMRALGVAYRRHDFMKPVLVPAARSTRRSSSRDASSRCAEPCHSGGKRRSDGSRGVRSPAPALSRRIPRRPVESRQPSE